MKLGVYGGSFDPIHNGHLLFAQQMLDEGHLDKILFVPAQKQYMKADHEASFMDRCTMVRYAIAGNPRFELEVISDDLNTYTYNTLVELKKRYPEDDLFFIGGMDIVESLEKWYKIEELGKYCTMFIGEREMDDCRDTRLQVQWVHAQLDKISQKYDLPYITVWNLIGLSVSSTIIRQKVKERMSLAYLVPEQVSEYIYTYDLYKE